MLSRFVIIATAGLVLSGPLLSAKGQANRLVTLDHWAYEYVERLQHRGHLLELHPTALPYTYGEVRDAVANLRLRGLSTTERAWAERLLREFGSRKRSAGVRERAGHQQSRGGAANRRERRALVGGVLQPGMRMSSHHRLDPIRHLESADPTLEAGGLSFFPNVAGRLFLEYGPFVAQAGLRFDVYYRDDPDGLDAANRLITRNEDAYAGFGSRFFSAYLGRFTHQWAPPRREALLLSQNTVGFDQIALRLGGRRLALRSVLGELDSMTSDGRFTGAAGADSVAGSVRRFLASHRLDWRPSRHVALTLMESTIYSSESSGISLKFLNPLNLHAFAVDGRPKNDENNGLLAGMLWAQYRPWTLQGQLLIDDIDLMGQTGEPLSAAVSGSIVYAGWPAADMGGSLTAVTARAYNTHQPEGRYVLLLRGIGTQFSDYVEVSAFAAFYRPIGRLDLAVRPKINLLQQGVRDIRQPYPSSDDDVGAILTGDVSRSLRPALEVRLQGGRLWWLTVDAGALFSNREDLDSRFTIVASMAARLDVVDRINIGL